MNRLRIASCLTALLALFVLSAPASADPSVAEVARDVNRKVVKLFGSGGFRGLVHYGSGFLVSPDGYILTVASPMLDTADLRVHLYDGRRFHAKVVVIEPELDTALVKIDLGNTGELPYFDVVEAAKRPLAEPGTAVLAFSNLFEIATRDEPVSVQQGFISARAKLQGRRGIFDAPFSGEVYLLDAITNNPGAAGGVITTRRGELLGIIGKELKNTLSDTWINYAMPIQTQVENRTGEQVATVSLVDIIQKKELYRPIVKEKAAEGPGGFHGIVLVPDVVERTPPYVEDVIPDSPAAKAGLKPDDLIVYVDGEQVVSIKAFQELIARARPGTEVQVEVRRGDNLTGVTLKLEAPKTQTRK